MECTLGYGRPRLSWRLYGGIVGCVTTQEYETLGSRPIPTPVTVPKFPGALGEYVRREHVHVNHG